MTITPVKFTVKHSVLVEGHRVDDGIYVGQKISDTEIERRHRRKHSFFLHIVEPVPEKTPKVAERFDLDVTALVSTGAISVS
jgi:ribosomal protein L44E